MKTLTTGPLGVLPGAPTTAIIIVDEDVDAGPPLGVLIFRSIAVRGNFCKKDCGND
jgi:hypothetical protein